MESYIRQDQYTTYGCCEWCHVLLALGDVDELIVSLMNELVEERRALAATQGLTSTNQFTRVPLRHRLGTIYRAHHDESAATSARIYAKALDKRVVTEEEMWKAGTRKRYLPWDAWNRLLADRDAAWDHTEALSYASGCYFYDRRGNKQQHDPGDFLGLALRRWCLARGVPYH
jgi:hypothetical protein